MSVLMPETCHNLLYLLCLDTHIPNSLKSQISFIVLLLVNTIFMPVIVCYSKKKIQKILNPDINASYSIISIRIL